jgi:hypothetical protein
LAFGQHLRGIPLHSGNFLEPARVSPYLSH